MQVHKNIVKPRIRMHGNIDKIFGYNADNIFTYQNPRNFIVDFFLKPIIANIFCETNVFKKLLLLGAAFMTFTLIFWPTLCSKSTLFLHSCIIKMF